MNARTPGPLADIELKTKDFADARAKLAEHVEALNVAVEALKRASMPVIRRALARAAERAAELKAAIEDAPQSFEKPRSHVFHGIKVGYRKGAGGIAFDDAERVVALIEKHLSEQADVLLKVTKKPVKKALEQLDGAELKKIGVTVEDTGDVAFIKPVDSALDKHVNALLKEATAEAKGE